MQNKITKIREELQNGKIESLLISNLNNIWYLTGFSASFAKLLITKNEIILISDSRYSVNAQKLCNNLEIKYIEINSDKNFWNNICEKYEIKNIGIEADEVTVSGFNTLKKKCKNINFIETRNIIEKIRIKKSKDEIDILRKCAEIGDLSLQKVVERFKEGITEKELAWIFEKSAREIFGASGLSFDTIVAFAENSASPHHESSNKKLEKNTPILIDCGVKYKNYI
ncbi:TPA: aminopeptidase P family protein [Candidatus Peregrinibacteria bacterium]|nr:aminopeptidase P family protein [Candidatus Peregrinibacteria bacterium]